MARRRDKSKEYRPKLPRGFNQLPAEEAEKIRSMGGVMAFYTGNNANLFDAETGASAGRNGAIEGHRRGTAYRFTAEAQKKALATRMANRAKRKAAQEAAKQEAQGRDQG